VNVWGRDEKGSVGTPLWLAAVAVTCGEAGGLELARLLIERGADVTAGGQDEDGVASSPLW
jgi:hypothetical protein